MRQIHTFFKADGTEFRVRADVQVADMSAKEDWASVSASGSAYRKLVKAGPIFWGQGRFAPVRNISLSNV